MQVGRIKFSPYSPIAFSRDQFLTPFDKIFDQILVAQFPEFIKAFGVTPTKGSAYPKVNAYNYNDKITIIAEIPGLDKKDLSVVVEDGILTISGNRHGLPDFGAELILNELKRSSFKRSFDLGDELVGNKIKAVFKDGLLTIDIPKIKPVEPERNEVKIG